MNPVKGTPIRTSPSPDHTVYASARSANKSPQAPVLADTNQTSPPQTATQSGKRGRPPEFTSYNRNGRHKLSRHLVTQPSSIASTSFAGLRSESSRNADEEGLKPAAAKYAPEVRAQTQSEAFANPDLQANPSSVNAENLDLLDSFELYPELLVQEPITSTNHPINFSNHSDEMINDTIQSDLSFSDDSLNLLDDHAYGEIISYSNITDKNNLALTSQLNNSRICRNGRLYVRQPTIRDIEEILAASNPKVKGKFLSRPSTLKLPSELNDTQLDQLVNLGLLNSISSLSLARCESITDAGLGHLARLRHLTQLDLDGTVQITDAGLWHLAGLSQLTKLKISFCDQITGAGLRHLAGLSHLTQLELYSCWGITDTDLQHLAGLSHLTQLDLGNCLLITDAGLQHLAGLSQLKHLDLFYCHQITDAGLQLLAGLPDLVITR